MLPAAGLSETIKSELMLLHQRLLQADGLAAMWGTSQDPPPRSQQPALPTAAPSTAERPTEATPLGGSASMTSHVVRSSATSSTPAGVSSDSASSQLLPSSPSAPLWGKVASVLLTLVPPASFSLTHPGAFLSVLQVVGTYGMTLLYGVLPPVMAWSLRFVPSKNWRAVTALEGVGLSVPVLNKSQWCREGIFN